MTPDERLQTPMTREEALYWAKDASERHDKLEDRLLELEIFLRTTGLKPAEKEEAEFLWDAHDLLERETISAYATLHCIDPEACARLREGLEP